MQTFEYTAWDRSGNCHQGLRQADSRQEILNYLRHENMTPVSIVEMELTLPEERAAKVRARKVRSEHLAAFCWQLATMLEGGLSITSAIQTIAEETQNVYFEHVLLQIASALEQGEPLSAAIAQYPGVFNHMARAMLMAGETSGSLVGSLQHLADYYLDRDKLSKKVKGAMAYPIFVISFIILIVVALMTFIVPRFEIMFKQFKGELPAFTRAFMAFYHGTVSHLPYLLVGLAAVGLGLFVLSKTQFGRLLICRIELNLPLIGSIKRMAFVSIFCRTMSLLVSSGVSVLDAYRILADMTSNQLLRNAVLEARRQVTEGRDMASSLASSGYFPGVAVKMTQIGEQTGSMVSVMKKTSEFYSRKVEERIASMLGMMEPILIVSVGAVVLVVLLAMYLPIFSMSV